MRLQSPVKIATRYSTNWHHELLNLDDFKRCICQLFGENQLPIYKELGLAGHNGIDISLENGDPIYAAHDGIIDFAGTDSMSYMNGPAGLGITLKGDGYKTIYWHLLEFKVKPGDRVKMGDLIALGDNTGYSTGSHLHFGLKLLDNAGNVLDRNNGYDGAVDPLPYIVWWDSMTEKEVLQLQALEGYSDLEGAKYWVGKPLEAYLTARLADKIKTITEVQ